ncbi:MAG: hypothetical protein H5U01_06785 [Clostridia bacterium]|nr:hypothetical protein [Clostridia bacterium]
MAHRVVTLLQRIGAGKDFAIVGSSKNIGIVSRSEKELAVKALKPRYGAQVAWAIVTGLFAMWLLQKAK